jgi:hypothetical protein
MLRDIKSVLAAEPWEEGDPAPTVPLALFFEGNDQEQSIAPNQWGVGRPPIAQMYEIFKNIEARDDVQTVVVGLHFDWNDKTFPDDWPPAENVHIYTSASQAEVDEWIEGLQSDGAGVGWPYGEPRNAPKAKSGHAVYTVYWD